jgi:FMN phosphatase YigB (HAD superfamily)
VAFEFSVTAQDVGAYKPARPHFDRGRERAAGRAWLHAAQSHFHDVRPARALGVPVAWINRKGESPVDGVRPDRELPDLAALADWLAPAAA